MTTTRRGFFGAIAAVIAAAALPAPPAQLPPVGWADSGTSGALDGETFWWLNAPDGELQLHVTGVDAPMCYGYLTTGGEWVERVGTPRELGL